MSSPRDRDGSDADGWREPAHLGDDGTTPRGPADTPRDDVPRDDVPRDDVPRDDVPRDDPRDDDLRDRPPAQGVPQDPTLQDPTLQAPPPQRPGGLFGPRRPRTPGAVEQVFRYQGDTVGVQGWALQHGWTIGDGTAPEDAVLHELVATAPVRLTKDHRPAGVLRGRAGSLEMVAFDVVYASGRQVVPEYAVTAVPVLVPLPPLRLSPARLWKHRTGGLLQVPSGDPEFDTRWVLLAAEDGPVARRLVGDPTLRGLLLASDDGDEFWSAAGHVAVLRPDGHRPELVEHHARLLTAVVGALAAAV